MYNYSNLSKLLGITETEVELLDNQLYYERMCNKMCEKNIEMLGIPEQDKQKLSRKLFNAFPTVHNVIVGDAEHISDYLVEHEDIQLNNEPVAEIDHKYFVFERRAG